MDSFDSEEDLEQEKIPLFQPYVGDHLMRLKTDPQDDDIYIWRVIVTDNKIKKVWPGEESQDCPHKKLYWAIDFNKKFITLCNECDSFAYGHKLAEND